MRWPLERLALQEEVLVMGREAGETEKPDPRWTKSGYEV
jgi:hypothetical protein